MSIGRGLGSGDGYVDPFFSLLDSADWDDKSYGGYMTCKTVEAASGIFTLGSKSIPFPSSST